jgi:hypothetical protein
MNGYNPTYDTNGNEVPSGGGRLQLLWESPIQGNPSLWSRTADLAVMVGRYMAEIRCLTC